MKNNVAPLNTAFSLIEVLLTMTFNCCMLAILIHCTMQLCIAYHKNQRALEIQNSFLIARFNLVRDISSAGYNGCHIPGQAKNVVNNVAASYDLNVNRSTIAQICNSAAIECTHLVTPNILQLIKQQQIPYNSPILILYNVPQNFSYLDGNLHNISDELSVNFQQVPHLNDILEIHDCTNADRFSVSGIYSNRIQHAWPQNKHSLSQIYAHGSSIFRPSIIAYYLRATPSHKGKYFTLYRDDFQRNAVALISGITDFSVEINANSLLIKSRLTFYNQQSMEIICAPRNSSLASSSFHY